MTEVFGPASQAWLDHGFAFSWTTNEPGDTQVEYGTGTTYGRMTKLDSRLVTSHSQVIKGLARHTLYHFRIVSRDAAGNLTLSSDFSFWTR